VPGSTSTMPDTASTWTTPVSAVASSTTPPNTGTAAPHTPLRPPATVSGTSSVVAHLHDPDDLVGRRGTHDGCGELRDLAGERPVQRQRPPVAARLGDGPGGTITIDGGIWLDQRLTDRREARASVAAGTSTPGPDRREPLPNSSIGGVGDIGMFDSCVLFGLAQTSVVVELSFGLRLPTSRVRRR
jgi:hypothetical protein